jgi:tRNA acetyltransferase TAN1
MIENEKFDLIIEIEENEVTEELDEYIAIDKLEDKLNDYDQRFYIKESEFYNVFFVELMERNENTAMELAETSLKKNFEIIPIESVVSSQPEKILEKIVDTSKTKIKNGETFTIKCNIRGSKYIKTNKELFIDSINNELIKTGRKPDNTNPDWTIHIQVVGENTGISVVKNKSL